MRKSADVPPPQNLEAEQSVLGSIMVDENYWFDVAELLGPEDFYRDAHKTIFAALRALKRTDEKIDIVTVQEKLRGKGQLDAVGGTEYLMALIDSVPSAANAKHYAGIVRHKSMRRLLIDYATRTAQAGHDSEVPVPTLLADAHAEIVGLLNDLSGNPSTTYAHVVTAQLERLVQASRDGASLAGLPSGIPDLDSLTGGFMDGDLIVLGGRTSHGKTAAAQQIAETVARAGHPVLFFSLEMSAQQLGLRAFQAAANLANWRLRKPHFDDEEEARLSAAAATINFLPITIKDKGGLHYTEVQAQSRRAILEDGIRLVIVDYLQLLRGDASPNRDRELGTVTEGLQKLAQNHGIPVIALAQLSRRMEYEKREPGLADLRECGTIEIHSDVVIFVFRASREATTAKIIVAKHRNGATGFVDTHWQGYIMRFLPMDNLHGEPKERRFDGSDND